MVVFDDMELERKVTIYEKGPWQPTATYGEWQTRTGDIFSPKIPNDEPLRLECRHFLDARRRRGRPRRSAARDGLVVVARSSSCRPRSSQPRHDRDRRDRDRLSRGR